MSTGSFGSVVSINSMPESSEQAILLTSPLLRATQIVTSAVQPQTHQFTVSSPQGNRRKLSLSPLPFHHRSVSMTLDSSISPSKVGKPRSSSSHQQPQFMANFALDMYKSQSPVISETSDIEDSPQLLATSSGNKFGNQLLQTTSNISLLSLSQQLTNSNDSQSTIMMQDSESTSTLHSNLKQTNPLPPRPFMMQRKGSAPFTLCSNRKSSFNSPAVQATQFVNVQTRPGVRRPSSVSQSQVHISANSSASLSKYSMARQQPIQIRQNSAVNEPDSPPLVPTSLASSPSQFLLSQSSPPESVHSNSAFSQIPRSGNTNTHVKQLTSIRQQTTVEPQQHQQQQQHSKLKELIKKYSEEGIETNIPPVFSLTRENSITDLIGGRSPEFAPVSSTLPPMTPLELSPPPEFTCREDINIDNEVGVNEDDNLESEIRLSNQDTRNNSVTEDIFGETIDD